MLRLPAQKAAAAAGWATAFGYCLLAGFGVPAQRTLYMLSVVALALLLAQSRRQRQPRAGAGPC
jgi:competence protein ComEC